MNEQLKQVDKMLTDKEKKKKRKRKSRRSEKAAEEQAKQAAQAAAAAQAAQQAAVAQAAQQEAASSTLPLQTQRISQSNLPEQVILPMHLIQHGRGHQVSKAK